MKKPNYNMERMNRERAKQSKSTAKSESRALKRDVNRQSDLSLVADQIPADGPEGRKEED